MTDAVSTTEARAASLIEQIRSLAPLSDADVARATGTTDEVAAAWRAGRGEPRDWQLQRLEELREVVAKLAEAMDVAYIPQWLNKRPPRLGRRAPLDVIAGGEHTEVLAVAGEMIYPTFT